MLFHFRLLFFGFGLMLVVEGIASLRVSNARDQNSTHHNERLSIGWRRFKRVAGWVLIGLGSTLILVKIIREAT